MKHFIDTTLLIIKSRLSREYKTDNVASQPLPFPLSRPFPIRSISYLPFKSLNRYNVEETL